MYHVKLINGSERYLHECVSITITHLPDVDGSGIIFSLSPSKVRLALPTDGSELYIMNENGDTVDSYRWPPKNKEASEHSEVTSNE